MPRMNQWVNMSHYNSEMQQLANINWSMYIRCLDNQIVWEHVILDTLPVVYKDLKVVKVILLAYLVEHLPDENVNM